MTYTWMTEPKVSLQIIAQSITLPLLAYLLPMVHPGAMCSQGKHAHAPGYPRDVKENAIHQIHHCVFKLSGDPAH